MLKKVNKNRHGNKPANTRGSIKMAAERAVRTRSAARSQGRVIGDRVIGTIFQQAASGVDGSWQLQTAKAKFSELFRLARTEGPQRITRLGKEGVVMISDEQYDRLMAKLHQPKSIVQFFRESPLTAVDLDLRRDKDSGRDIEI